MKRRLMSVAIASAMIVTGANAANSQTRDDLSGSGAYTVSPEPREVETAFDEIFFATGPKARELAKHLKDPAYSSLLNSEASGESHAESRRIIKEKIQQQQPGFIDYFNTEIASGDPYRAERALTEGGELMLQAIEAEANDRNSNVAPQCLVWFAGAAVVWSLGALVNIAAAVNVETAVTVHHWVMLAQSKPLFAEDQAEFDRQKTVNAILKTYR